MLNIAESFVRLVLIGGFFCVLEATGLAILGFCDSHIAQVYTKSYDCLASLTGTPSALSFFFGAITLGVTGLFLDLAGTWIPGIHESRIFREHIIKNKTWMDRFVLNWNEYTQEDWNVLMEEINESKLHSLTPSGIRGFIPTIELWRGLKFAFNKNLELRSMKKGERELNTSDLTNVFKHSCFHA